MDFIWKLEYHEGYYAAGNEIPFDESKSDAWKEGYRDGEATLYGEEQFDIKMEDVYGY